MLWWMLWFQGKREMWITSNFSQNGNSSFYLMRNRTIRKINEAVGTCLSWKIAKSILKFEFNSCGLDTTILAATLINYPSSISFLVSPSNIHVEKLFCPYLNLETLVPWVRDGTTFHCFIYTDHIATQSNRTSYKPCRTTMLIEWINTLNNLDIHIYNSINAQNYTRGEAYKDEDFFSELVNWGKR